MRNQAHKRVLIIGSLLLTGYYLLKKILKNNHIEKFFVCTDALLNVRVRENKVLKQIKQDLIHDTIARLDNKNSKVLEIGTGLGGNFQFYPAGKSVGFKTIFLV